MKFIILFLITLSLFSFAQQKEKDSVNKIVEKQIQEVEITAKKKLIERKVDRLVFNVENSISATGGDAVDALKVTPGLKVNNDQISMIGKSRMSLMVDDRLIQLSGDELTNFLRIIKSDDIKSIEVITNPPAKYDAEGNSGIVNIKLKKAKSNSWSTLINSTLTVAKYALGSGRLGFNYQKDKITLVSTISYSNGSNSSLETQYINYPIQTSYSLTNTREYSNRLSYKLGIDYKISRKISLGILYLGSTSNPNSTNTINNSIISKDTNLIDHILITDQKNKLQSINNALNFHTIYKIDTIGRKLSMDVDYFNFKTNKNQLFTTFNTNYINQISTNVTEINNIGNQNRENFSFKLDMEHPLNKISLNYGGRISFTNTINDIAYYDINSGLASYNPNYSSQFNYRENNQALYMSANKKWKEKWEGQAGIRIENTQTIGNSITLNQITKHNYTQVFPTGFITYKPNDNHSFSFNYGRRISRPKYNWVNPFRIYYSSYSYFEGNPNLEPSYIKNLELAHTYKGKLNTSLYYSIEKNGYGPLSILNYTNLNQVSSFYNYYTQISYGINENYTFDKFWWWESNLSGNLSYFETSSFSSYTQPLVKGWNASLSSSNSFILNKSKTFLGSFDINYSFPSTYGISKYSSVFFIGGGIRYTLLNKQMQISSTIYDILGSNKQKWSQYSNGIFTSNTNFEISPQITLSISYKFGNTKLKIRDQKIGNSEDSGRADSK